MGPEGGAKGAGGVPANSGGMGARHRGDGFGIEGFLRGGKAILVSEHCAGVWS